MEWKVFYDKFMKYKYDNGIITDNDSNNIVELFSIYANRNQTGTTGDNKKCAALYPFTLKYGHANGDSTSNPITNTLYGVYVQSTWIRGYCGIASDLTLTGGIASGTMGIGAKYGIYQTSNFGSNYLSANVGIKNTKPTSSLSVSGTFATLPYNYIDQDANVPSYSLITMTPNTKDVNVNLPTAKESMGRIYRISRGVDSSYKCNINPNQKAIDANTKFLWDCQTLTESSTSNLPIVLSGDSGLYAPSSERISNSGLKVLKLQFGASAKITNSTNIPLSSMNTIEFYNYVPYFNSLTTKSWLFDMRQNETDIAPWAYVNFIYNVGMQINFGIGTTTYITNYVSSNTWYHVAVYISPSTLKLFIDGVCIGISNFSTPLVFASVPYIYLGDSPLHTDTQSQAYYIDDIRISSSQRYASNGNTNIPINKYNLPDVIDGETLPLQLYNKGDYIIIQSDGDKWNVLKKYIRSTVYQEPHTYSELSVMVANSQLIAGKQYLLSDYKTKYRQPYTSIMKEMNIERLVLTANSTNSFEIICSSLDYPKDIIYYDFNDSKCEDNTTPRNGFIQRRIDVVKSIDCPNDWRTMLWVRYLIDPNQYLIGTTLTNYEIWQEGTNAKLDVIYKDGNSLLVAFDNTSVPEWSMDENVFTVIVDDITKGISYNIENKKVGKTSNNVDIYLKILNSYTEHTTFSSNVNVERVSILKTSLHNNVFLCTTNPITDIAMSFTCYNNTFTSYISVIDFKESCNNNLFTGNSNIIILDSLCSNNYFWGNCGKISMGNSCANNIFVGLYSMTMKDSCVQNIINTNCAFINMDNACTANNFGVSCVNISLSSICQNNIFGNNKKNLSIKNLQNKNISSVFALTNRNYNTNIESRADDKYVYWNLDSNNVPIYTVIT